VYEEHAEPDHRGEAEVDQIGLRQRAPPARPGRRAGRRRRGRW
jgi:hypothetical protein